MWLNEGVSDKQLENTNMIEVTGMNKKRREFLDKLADLLEEYDVEIGFFYNGDSQGIYDEAVTFSQRGNQFLAMGGNDDADANGIREALK